MHRSPSPKSSSEESGCARRAARGCWRLVVITLQLSIIAALLGLLALAGGYAYLSNQLDEAIDRVVSYQGSGPGGNPRFYDRNGQLLFELHTVEKRRWLDYDEIPRVVIDATIAVEDDTFWSNPGFDAPSIVAAAISNFRNEGQRPIGASTITQQLVRHIAFSYEERVATSYERKLREIFLAFILTQKREKRDIITMYLNEIYYGNLAYGIEAAAQTYFGKAAADLTLAEAAFLAGLPQSPVELDPYVNFEAAQNRQKLVLRLMESEEMISALDVAVAQGVSLNLQPLLPQAESQNERVLHAPHFVLYVQRHLEERYGPDALTQGGWQVTTTLDLNIQQLAQETLRQQVAARQQAHDVNNGAAVVMKPGTGEILAMVGSLDYFDESIDGQVNVTLRPRQPGSSIKPITYAAAMEKGWTTGDVLWDVPIVLELGNGEQFIPRNYDGRYRGPILFRDALANSYNIPPIQLIRDVGIGNMIATARKMGIVSLNQPPGYYGLTLTLGGGEVPLLEMTHAFATLANMGQRPQLNTVLQIRDGRGRMVYDAQQDRTPPTNALDPRIAYIITDILDDDQARVPAMGANNPLHAPFPAAVKTGTTDDFRDNWTIGYTPGVVVGIWLGNSDGHPMVNTSGLQGAAPVWRYIIETITNDPALNGSLAVAGAAPPVEFPQPSGIEQKAVCLPHSTGGSSCSATRPDLFLVSAPQHSIPRLGYVPDAASQPGAWTLATLPLPADVAVRIQESRNSDDEATLSTPTHCVINSAAIPSGVERQLFLPLPPYYPDEVRARLWAQRAGGYPMAPPVVCPADLVRSMPNEQGDQQQVSTNQTYRIASPQAGQQVSGLVEIQGTAMFDPAQVQFYKLEIGSGSNPTEWTTLGVTHAEPVSNGKLEELHAYALPPGPYVLRLVLVQNDGNFPPPHAVPITIVE